MLELQLSLLPERPYQGRTSLHGTQAIARAALQVVEVGGAAVGEFVMLQMSPDVFGRIQFRCVGRLWISADCVLLAVNDVLNRIQISPCLYFPRSHDFGTSDLGHYYLPEWRKRDVLWTATLIDNFATWATPEACFCRVSVCRART
jgi:hypothetical protein